MCPPRQSCGKQIDDPAEAVRQTPPLLLVRSDERTREKEPLSRDDTGVGADREKWYKGKVLRARKPRFSATHRTHWGTPGNSLKSSIPFSFICKTEERGRK